MLSTDEPAGTRPDLPKAEAPFFAKTVRSPIGPLRLVASELGLVAVLWPEERPGRVPLDTTFEGTSPLLDAATVQLEAYFAGRLQTFDLPLDPRGTPFQREVWTALRAIPYGETRSYRDIAVALGRPTATRAVGAANGRNPISIIVPCHRVVGANGALTGFAGGLAVKEHLLALEGARLF